MKMLGIILIIVGVIALGFQAISFTRKEKVIDAGPIEITADQKETIPLPPILGAVALIAGIVLVVRTKGG
jgi:uncharacterized membrane protein HdeD (DUF308 family)